MPRLSITISALYFVELPNARIHLRLGERTRARPAGGMRCWANPSRANGSRMCR